MFNMFRSRDKVVRLLLGGLLGIVALSMLVYLIPGAGMPTGDRNDQIVAEIGKEAVTVQDVERDLQDKMRGRQIPPDVLGVFVPQDVDFMIAERAVAYEAKRMGFQVNDSQLANAIRSMGQVSSLTPEQYRDYLAQQGYSVPEFENNVRTLTLVNDLNNLSTEGVIVTPAEVEREYRRSFDKIKLDYIGFSAEKLKAEMKPAPEELKNYFLSRRGQFMVPQSRSLQIMIADPVKIAASLPIPEAQLQQFYDSHKENFRTPERVKVRHILLKTTDVPKDQVAKIKAKAEDVLKQVKNGGDFAKLAEKYSEDPGSAKNGGDLGWIVRSQMVKNFENAAFSLKPGQISDLVTTEYGFHILQVQDRQDAHLQPFDEVKAQIAAELKKQVVNDRMQTSADQARAEWAKAPQNGQQIANKYGLIFATVDNHKAGEPIPEIGADQNIDTAIGELKKGDVSQVQQAGAKLVIVEVTNILPTHPAEYADVETQVRNYYLQENASKLVTEKSRKAADMLKANGGNLQDVAKALGGEVKSTDLFTRGGAAEGLGSAAPLGEAFAKPVGGIVGPITIGPQTIVAKVVEKGGADMSKLPEQRDAILQQLKSKKAEERTLLFQDSVVSKLAQEGKIKVHKDVLNRLIARYRG